MLLPLSFLLGGAHMDEPLTQVRAEVPHRLKCLLFSRLALLDLRFNAWLKMQMEQWLQDNQWLLPDHVPQKSDKDSRAVARCETGDVGEHRAIGEPETTPEKQKA